MVSLRLDSVDPGIASPARSSCARRASSSIRRGRFDPYARRVLCANAHIGADFAVLARDSGRSGGAAKAALVEFTIRRLNSRDAAVRFFGGAATVSNPPRIAAHPKSHSKSGLRVSRVTTLIGDVSYENFTTGPVGRRNSSSTPSL